MRNLRHAQAGDTIVEVLIAMTIVSLVLAGAYASSNRNIRSTLDAQEHGQALKLAESQVEYLRSAAQKAGSGYSFGSGAPDNHKCFDQTGHEVAGGSPGSDPCTVQSDGSPVAVGQEPAYILTIYEPGQLPDNPGTSYKFTVVWDTPVGALPNDGNVTMYYRPD